MNLSFTPHENILEIGLNGRLDAATSPAALDALNKQINAGQLKIVLDFSKLDYISSSGLRVLLMTLKTLNAKKGRLVIYGMKAHVREVFELAGFLSYFPTYAGWEEASAALGKE